MKAAVLHEAGGIPRYEDFPDPVAVAVENVDKAIAAGTHYASEKYIGRFPVIPAFDGIGALPDGTLAGFGNIRLPYGALAEKAVVPQGSYMPMPDGIDPAVVAVMASAVAAMSMKTAAGFVPGQTVLVQGATGVAGRLAVKVARLLEPVLSLPSPHRACAPPAWRSTARPRASTRRPWTRCTSRW